MFHILADSVFCRLFRKQFEKKVYCSMKYLRDFTGLALNPFLNPVQHLGRNLKSWLHAQPTRSDSSSSDVFFMCPSRPHHMCSSPSGTQGWCTKPTALRRHTRLQNLFKKCLKNLCKAFVVIPFKHKQTNRTSVVEVIISVSTTAATNWLLWQIELLFQSLQNS